MVWFRPGARLLIAGQAPGARVHASGQPFTDRSGDRLRDWTGLEAERFYDRDRVAIVPMAFCFPGYDAKGADLPPPPLCAATWRAEVMAALRGVRLVLAVGGAAIRWHIGPGRWRRMWRVGAGRWRGASSPCRIRPGGIRGGCSATPGSRPNFCPTCGPRAQGDGGTMTVVTLLDAAHAAVSANPEDETARLRFYERLADGEMFLLLEREAKGEVLDPKVFDWTAGGWCWSSTARNGWPSSRAGLRPMRRCRGGWWRRC